MINGELTSDKELWADEVAKFGAHRFNDDANDFQNQASRLETLQTVSQNEVLDGIFVPTLDMFNVLSCRTRMKEGTCAGVDTAPPEVYRALPCYVVYKIFEQYFC